MILAEIKVFVENNLSIENHKVTKYNNPDLHHTCKDIGKEKKQRILMHDKTGA